MHLPSPTRRALFPILLSALLPILATTAHAKTKPQPQPKALTGYALVQALQHGGYIIAMRHASSPREAPPKDQANPDNTQDERQLDDKGRATAAAMGRALRDLKIPIGEILTSPTYRALETIKYAALGAAKPTPELAENGASMQPVTAEQTDWLQHRVTQFPTGTNTLLITHFPNLIAAFPQQALGITDGEALIFGPDGKGGATLVARIKMEAWPTLVP